MRRTLGSNISVCSAICFTERGVSDFSNVSITLCSCVGVAAGCVSCFLSDPSHPRVAGVFCKGLLYIEPLVFSLTRPPKVVERPSPVSRDIRRIVIFPGARLSASDISYSSTVQSLPSQFICVPGGI